MVSRPRLFSAVHVLMLYDSDLSHRDATVMSTLSNHLGRLSVDSMIPTEHLRARCKSATGAKPIHLVNRDGSLNKIGKRVSELLHQNDFC